MSNYNLTLALHLQPVRLQMECMTHQGDNEVTYLSGGSVVFKRLFIHLFIYLKTTCWWNNDTDLST